MTTATHHPPAPVPPRRPAVRWWRRPWMVPLGFIVTVFLVFSLPPYLGLDPARSRVPPPEGVGWYYPVLATHIGFASIAMLSCVLQIWPWFRQRFPVAHRWIGRVYVFAGALPAGVAAFTIATVDPFGPVAAASNLMMATLWLFFTTNGFRAARARRFGEHRKWMVRSFALTMSIISNRIWAVVFAMTIAPGIVANGGGEAQVAQTLGGMTTWLGWTIPLLIAEAWLQRPKRRRAPAAGARIGA